MTCGKKHKKKLMLKKEDAATTTADIAQRDGPPNSRFAKVARAAAEAYLKRLADGKKRKKDKRESLDVGTLFNEAAKRKDTGGRWVTIRGRHMFIPGGGKLQFGKGGKFKVIGSKVKADKKKDRIAGLLQKAGDKAAKKAISDWDDREKFLKHNKAAIVLGTKASKVRQKKQYKRSNTND